MNFIEKENGKKYGDYVIYSGPSGMVPFDGTYLNAYNDTAKYTLLIFSPLIIFSLATFFPYIYILILQLKSPVN
mgnify:CR=1 FL=1